jgi:hypothetical protein
LEDRPVEERDERLQGYCVNRWLLGVREIGAKEKVAGLVTEEERSEVIQTRRAIAPHAAPLR